MFFCLAVFAFNLLLFGFSEETILEGAKHCVPTASTHGPCHDCICSAEGVYHCRRRQCFAVDLNQRRAKEDCQPKYVYRENTTFCMCNEDGFWQSDNCQQSFRFVHPKTNRMQYELRTNVICVPGLFYVIDCNICRCESNGFIDVTACTNRFCFNGQKADACNSGDFLRIDNELCACSDIRFYIDRLCITVRPRPVQTIAIELLSQLVEVGSSWRRVYDILYDVCNTEVVYTVDCNKCVCADNQLVCTTRTCQLKRKIALRYEKPYDRTKSEFESLPELQNFEDRCTPGKTYRYKCNTCQCMKNGVVACANITSRSNLPVIRPGQKCKDGVVYKMDCNTCSCFDKKLMCTRIACMDIVGQKNTIRQKNKKSKKVSKREPQPKVFEIDDKEFMQLQALPHHAAPCVPSKKYRVDCNACFCNKKKILICEKKLCVDQKSTRQIEATKKSGKPCSESYVSKKCIKCKCKNGKSDCEAKSVEDCQTDDDKMLLSKSGSKTQSRLTFDFKKEECIPDMVYKDMCNKCYCQPDKSLRCTRKMCLNYAQALKLEEHREYLVQHGL